MSGPGDVLELIRERRAFTRGDVLEVTGLSRMTVATRIDALLDAGLIIESGTERVTSGRPSRRLEFNTAHAPGASPSRSASRSPSPTDPTIR